MDHVPPRAIFPEKLPSGTHMVTAPACQPCHDDNQKDDSTIRNLLISIEYVEQHPAILGGLAGKRDRSFSRSMNSPDGDFLQVLSVMKLIDRETPAGVYIGKDWAIDYDNAVMNRFVCRLGRALLYYEFGQSYFEGHFGWRLNLEVPKLVYEGMHQFGKVRKVTDVFAYGVTPLKDSGPGWVVANFYGRTEFLIRIENAEPVAGGGATR